MTLWNDELGMASPLPQAEEAARLAIDLACSFLAPRGVPRFFHSRAAAVPRDDAAVALVAAIAPALSSVPEQQRELVQAAVIRHAIDIKIRGGGESGAARLRDHLAQEGYAPAPHPSVPLLAP